MQNFIQEAWRKKTTFFYCVLVPLSWIFALLIVLRRWAYRFKLLKSYALSVPVIVVGNIHVGGSGKTPLVIWLVEQLRQKGFEPAVISRGYGGSTTLPTEVNAASNPKIVGDEPVLIANRCLCPIWVGSDRVHVGLELLKANPKCNVIICDDGLQHYRLNRNVEIAVIDAETYLKNARLLPSGNLREPLNRLESTDAVVINGHIKNDVDLTHSLSNTFQMDLVGAEFYNLIDPNITATAENFKCKSIKAIAGIGNPARFFEHIRQLGLNFSSSSFEDHHAFTAADVSQLKCDALLMTEKDAVKCKPFAQSHHWILPVEAIIKGDLMQLVLKNLQKQSH